MKKLQVFHFHNGAGGGVLAVIKNLLKYSDNLVDNHIIHAINSDLYPGFKIEPVSGVHSQQVFQYTAENNFYHTCRCLARMLPDDQALIVAHDWVELGMASNLGLKNKVVQIVHGNYDYYYDLAVRHSHITDAFICISKQIYLELQKRLPVRKEAIKYLRFPVPKMTVKRKENSQIHLIYYVRDLNDTNKQFQVISDIAQRLSGIPDRYFFTIIGEGLSDHEFDKLWPVKMKSQVNYMRSVDNEQIPEILSSKDLFLLPSIKEGLPVSLIESMKAGLVPLVSKWDESIEEIVQPGVTGYYFENTNAEEYAACIERLYHNREMLKTLSLNCIALSNELYDPLINTEKFTHQFLSVAEKPEKRSVPKKIYGSTLDQPWLNNKVTKKLRKLLHA